MPIGRPFRKGIIQRLETLCAFLNSWKIPPFGREFCRKFSSSILRRLEPGSKFTHSNKYSRAFFRLVLLSTKDAPRQTYCKRVARSTHKHAKCCEGSQERPTIEPWHRVHLNLPAATTLAPCAHPGIAGLGEAQAATEQCALHKASHILFPTTRPKIPA